MTRDEILNQLNTIILWADECAEMEIDGDLLKGIVAARDLLDIPQPDAETGLMPCGCGGWPDIISPNSSIALYLVQCDRCHIETDCYDTKQDAIDAWNKALG